MSRHIDESATVAASSDLGLNVVIEADVTIGEGTRIGHGTVICEGSRIGRNVTIAQNSVIGKKPASGASSKRNTSAVGPVEIGDETVVGACVVLYAGVPARPMKKAAD